MSIGPFPGNDDIDVTERQHLIERVGERGISGVLDPSSLVEIVDYVLRAVCAELTAVSYVIDGDVRPFIETIRGQPVS